MKLQSLSTNAIELPKISVDFNKGVQKDPVTNFENIFNQYVSSVNNDQLSSSKTTSDFLNGGDVEIHQVMISAEKAKTSLDLLMEIRNKTVDMYKELSRMQV